MQQILLALQLFNLIKALDGLEWDPLNLFSLHTKSLFTVKSKNGVLYSISFYSETSLISRDIRNKFTYKIF